MSDQSFARRFAEEEKNHLETLASARERTKLRKRWPRRPTPSSLSRNEVFLKHKSKGDLSTSWHTILKEFLKQTSWWLVTIVAALDIRMSRMKLKQSKSFSPFPPDSWSCHGCCCVQQWYRVDYEPEIEVFKISNFPNVTWALCGGGWSRWR